MIEARALVALSTAGEQHPADALPFSAFLAVLPAGQRTASKKSAIYSTVVLFFFFWGRSLLDTGLRCLTGGQAPHGGRGENGSGRERGLWEGQAQAEGGSVVDLPV